jgi:hypothetical protein
MLNAYDDAYDDALELLEKKIAIAFAQPWNNSMKEVLSEYSKFIYDSKEYSIGEKDIQYCIKNVVKEMK